jgi:hypothetical protein
MTTVSDDEINVLERQIQDLQNRIDYIRADRAAQKAAARKAAALARPKPVAAKKVASNGPKSNLPQHRRKSTNGGAGTHKKKHHKSRDDSEDVEETVTFEMKRELAVKITSFEGDNLERAIDIIRMGRPDLLSVRLYFRCSFPSCSMHVRCMFDALTNHPRNRTRTKRLNSISINWINVLCYRSIDLCVLQLGLRQKFLVNDKVSRRARDQRERIRTKRRNRRGLKCSKPDCEISKELEERVVDVVVEQLIKPVVTLVVLKEVRVRVTMVVINAFRIFSINVILSRV